MNEMITTILASFMNPAHDIGIVYGPSTQASFIHRISSFIFGGVLHSTCHFLPPLYTCHKICIICLFDDDCLIPLLKKYGHACK